MARAVCSGGIKSSSAAERKRIWSLTAVLSRGTPTKGVVVAPTWRSGAAGISKRVGVEGARAVGSDRVYSWQDYGDSFMMCK